jgi:GntR family transcriptional regulator
LPPLLPQAVSVIAAVPMAATARNFRPIPYSVRMTSGAGECRNRLGFCLLPVVPNRKSCSNNSTLLSEGCGSVNAMKRQSFDGTSMTGVRRAQSRRRTLHERIADDLRRAIAVGEFPRGAQLPTEAALAERYGAARGTVRAALQSLTTEGLVAARRGTPRIVLGTSMSQSFSQLMSFAQWATSTGHIPGGRFVERTIRGATDVEAAGLQVREGDEIVHTVRVRTLDDTPILVERSAYPLWAGEAIMALPADCPSLTIALEERIGLVLASGTHTFDIVRANKVDARLLGIRVDDPLLRRRGITRMADGAPSEYTEDRFLEGSASFTVHNSVGHNPVTRDFPIP